MLRLLAMACLLVAMIALNFSFELLGAPAGAFSQLETANTLNALSYLSAAIAGLILLLFVAFLFPKKAKKMMP